MVVIEKYVLAYPYQNWMSQFDWMFAILSASWRESSHIDCVHSAHSKPTIDINYDIDT